MLRRRRLPGGDELAVLDRILTLFAAVKDRAQATVGKHLKAVFALLLNRREINLEVQQAFGRNLGGENLVLVADVAEVAAIQNAAVGADLIGQHGAIAMVRWQRAVERPRSEQSPFAHGLGDRIIS